MCLKTAPSRQVSAIASIPPRLSLKKNNTFTDPVCGMQVEPVAARGGATVHQGTTYYFCNSRCREQFLQNPEQFIRKTKELHPAPVPSHRSLYFCPMDTEIRQDEPGACPKCGMDLELDVVGPAEG